MEVDSVHLPSYWGTAFPFLRIYLVLAAKRVGANLMNFAAPEIADVVSGIKSFKSRANNVGGKTLRKHLGSGS